jgi:hypothetical protein
LESGNEKSRSKIGSGNDGDDDNGDEAQHTGEVQEQTVEKKAEGKTPPKCTDNKDSSWKGEGSKILETGDKGTVSDVEKGTAARVVPTAKSVEVTLNQNVPADAKAKQVF